MAFNIWCGLPRSGKSCIMVNKVLASWLLNSTRQIYHNLPFTKGEQNRLPNFLAFLARTSAMRRQYEDRLHFLPAEEREAFDAQGNSLGVHSVQREWWYFVPANAVVIFDEAGGEYDATKSKARPEQLIEVFNRFGHAGWDLEFITQAYNNLDIQVRQKAHFVAEVHNSLNLSVFPGVRWLESIRYPIKFFQVWTYEGLDYFKRGSQGTVVDAYRVWPRAAYFRNYFSFSESAKVPWLRTLDDEKQESGDLIKDKKTRIKAALRQFKPLFKLCLWLGLGVWVFWGVMAELLRGGWMSDLGLVDALAGTGGTNSVASVQSGTNSVASVQSGTNSVASVQSGTNSVAVVPSPAVKVVFTSSRSWKLSTGKWLKRGGSVGTNSIEEISPERINIGGGWLTVEQVEEILK